MRFPYIYDAPVVEAKQQRSVFGFTCFLIISWIYYMLLHPYTVIQYMIIDPEPDLTVTQSEFRRLTEEKQKLKRQIDEALSA
jgi:hypothetical protein